MFLNQPYRSAFMGLAFVLASMTAHAAPLLSGAAADGSTVNLADLRGKIAAQHITKPYGYTVNYSG